MITSKERSFLRGLANSIPTIFQIGKEGITTNFIKQVEGALEARELIKVNVLPSSGLGAREASDTLCKKIHCEGVQAIGSKFVLYKRSKENPRIDL